MSLSSELPATSRKVHPLSRITRWRKAVQESRGSLPCGSRQGALCSSSHSSPQTRQRLSRPNVANLASRDRWKQILEANLHKVTCFQSGQVALKSTGRGIRRHVPGAVSRPRTRDTPGPVVQDRVGAGGGDPPIPLCPARLGKSSGKRRGLSEFVTRR